MCACVCLWAVGVDKHETCTRTGVLEKAIELCHRIISTSTFSSHAKARALEVQPKGTEVLPKKCCLSDKKASEKDMVSTLRDFFPRVNKEKHRSLAYFTARGSEFAMKSKRNSLASSGRGTPEPSSRSF